MEDTSNSESIVIINLILYYTNLLHVIITFVYHVYSKEYFYTTFKISLV